MDLQTAPVLRVRTPRIKAIASAPGYREVAVCLYTGEIQFYDPHTLAMTRSAKVCSVPIRTAAIIPSRDWVLVGTDEGNIVVLDLGNLSTVMTLQAHDDFVRKIAVDEAGKQFLTVSDDNTAKLWMYDKTITALGKYKAPHFVMDGAFCPSDSTMFVSVTLDCKAYLYSAGAPKPVKSFKGHERGINCLAFVSPECFLTGSDDASVIAWDARRGVKITRLTGHSGNVTGLARLKKGFVSCSEDGSVRVWDEDFRTTTIKTVPGRAWAVLEKDGKLFVGSDDGLVVFAEKRAGRLACASGNRLFFNVSSTIRQVKLDEPSAALDALPAGESATDLGAPRDLGTVDDGFRALAATPNGKFLAVVYPEHFSIFSTLGLRRKLTETATSPLFTSNDSFVCLADGQIKIFSGFELVRSVPAEHVSALLYVDENILVANTDKTCLFRMADLEGSSAAEAALLHRFGICATRAACLGPYLLLATPERIHFYDSEMEEAALVPHAADSWCVADDVLYFSNAQKTFYTFLADGQPRTFPLSHLPGICGIRGDVLYFVGESGVGAHRIHKGFIEFQRAVLSDPEADIPVDEAIVDRAIAFYSSLGHHHKALRLCRSDSQRFEILLRLGNLAEAARMADSPAKHEKLGRAFLRQGNLAMAAESFRHAGDIQNLLLADVFSGKKYLAEVGETARRRGMNNLAFMAYYKLGEYDKCATLLSGTRFYNAFRSTYGVGDDAGKSPQ